MSALPTKAKALEALQRIEALNPNPTADPLYGVVADYLAWASAEITRCHARLEIDQAWQAFDDNGDVTKTRVDIAMENRATWPDGIECRNETIKGQDENIARLRALLVELATINNTYLERASTAEDKLLRGSANAVTLLRELGYIVTPPNDGPATSGYMQATSHYNHDRQGNEPAVVKVAATDLIDSDRKQREYWEAKA